jgi:hypothetical protein
MVVVANMSSQRCCSCNQPSLTCTRNIVRAPGCDEDDVAYDVLPQALILLQPCNIYPKFKMLLSSGGS